MSGGFNGGGDSFKGGQGIGSGGGGGSDIRVKTDSLYARIIVAGGGGGGSMAKNTSKTGGVGGGTSGGGTNPGTQTSTSYGNIFGEGKSLTAPANQINIMRANPAGGGGGGWYGGLATHSTRSTGGVNGGGSGYIYTSSTASNYPSGCLLNSSYYLTDAQTIAGNTAFISPTGTNETGHTGDGYVRITAIKVESGNALVKTTSDTWKGQKQLFIKTTADTWRSVKGVWAKTAADTWKQTL